MLGKLSDHEIEIVLKRNHLGRIGCHDDGRTYVVPVNYVYDGKDIVAHSMYGMKIEMMRANPHICFEVDEVEDYQNWKSVIIWGDYQEITDPLQRYHAMKYFLDRLLEIKIGETALLPEISEVNMHSLSAGLAKPVIYRLVSLEKSGRYENNS